MFNKIFNNRISMYNIQQKVLQLTQHALLKAHSETNSNINEGRCNYKKYSI